MNKIWNLIQSEPVALQALLQASLSLLEAFGMHLTTEQMAEINVFTAAALAFFTRKAVTANSKINP